MKVVLSSGHGKFVAGASGYINEVTEARRVVDETATLMRELDIEVVTYHDDVSKSQGENLDRICDFHNAQNGDLNVSVHFNASDAGQVSTPIGCETLYLTQEELAKQVTDSICAASGLKNRGPKYRDNLAFLNNTAAPAILIEVSFVNSSADTKLYQDSFKDICGAIADGIAEFFDGDFVDVEVEEPEELPTTGVLFRAKGKCSYFGGPGDTTGVSADEGLAFIYELNEKNQHLFLPFQPKGSTGLARRLNPYVHYIACRWDYAKTSKTMLSDSGQVALVRATKTGITLTAIPSDWGPHEEKTGGRVADLSPSLMADLGVETDDEVEVIYPYKED